MCRVSVVVMSLTILSKTDLIMHLNCCKLSLLRFLIINTSAVTWNKCANWENCPHWLHDTTATIELTAVIESPCDYWKFLISHTSFSQPTISSGLNFFPSSNKIQHTSHLIHCLYIVPVFCWLLLITCDKI